MGDGSSDNFDGRFLGELYRVDTVDRFCVCYLLNLDLVPPYPASLPHHQARFAHPPPSDKNLPHHVTIDSTGRLTGAILSDEIMTAPCPVLPGAGAKPRNAVIGRTPALTRRDDLSSAREKFGRSHVQAADTRYGI